MPLFQKPPRTPEELERSKPLAIPPEEVGMMDERTWHQRAFRGDSAQLTVRAVAMGATALWEERYWEEFGGRHAAFRDPWGMEIVLWRDKGTYSSDGG